MQYATYGNHTKGVSRYLKILITGGSGFLGTRITAMLKGRYRLCSTFCSAPHGIAGCESVKLDLRSRQEVEKTVEKTAPDIIIHAAAVSSPDLCEKDKQTARDINTGGSHTLLGAAKRAGSPRMVYISTDMVFDGEKGGYTEQDIPAASNHYGMTKREAETLFLQEYENILVLRISLQYGWGTQRSASFTDWLYTNLKKGVPCHLFTDQFRTPLYVKDTVRAIEAAGIQSNARGLYHLGGTQKTDRYSFARLFATLFDFPETLLVKSTLEQVKQGAPRPRDVSLDSSLFYKTFHFQPRSLDEAFQDMLKKEP